jgi:protein dispatched 1
VKDEAKFIEYVKLFLKTQEGKKFEDQVVVRDDRVRFTWISAKTKCYSWNPSTVKQPQLDKWQNFVDEQEKSAPATMKGMLQSSDAWPGIPVEKAFVKGAFQGIIASICFSFLVLMIVTRNPITSIVSIFCVTVIILSIVTFMHWNGQQFGNDESIAVVMLIGFAVDYVLHLGTDYMHSLAATRHDKMKQSYREMGLSITSGCVTTFLCGVVLFFGNLIFFQKFAMVICLTAVMAYFMAMVVFGAIMHIIGPEKGFCTIPTKCGEKKDEV